jgi:hypothetical protein
MLYDRNTRPFGRSWERWAAIWCNWMLSIPKKNNPSLDETGRYCSVDQNDPNVWFLTGTFGNINQLVRRCIIPGGKAILFPILVKEDSFEEDSDLKTELELKRRSSNATNKTVYVEATIDGKRLESLENYRVQSEVFNLKFPEDNVYGVRPGFTRSVCDGYWLFVKPLTIGKHYIEFKGETLLEDPYTLAQLENTKVYRSIWPHINENLTFKLAVCYELTVNAYNMRSF